MYAILVLLSLNIYALNIGYHPTMIAFDEAPHWLLYLIIFLLLAYLLFNQFGYLIFLRGYSRRRNEIFRQFYTNSPIMMHSIDNEGNIIYVNDYWLKTLGYEKREVIGKKSANFFSGPVKDNYETFFYNLMKNGALRDFEATMMKKDGTEVFVLLTSEVIYDKNGKAMHAYSIIMDITERKKAELQVLESKHKLDSIMNNAVEAIFVLQNEKIQYANEVTASVLGYDPEELFNYPFQSIVYADDREWVLNNYKKRMRGEDVPQSYSFRVNKKKGDIIWVEIHALFLKWDNKPAVLIFLLDISERKKHEDILIKQAWDLYEQNEHKEKLNKELQEKNRVLDEHKEELMEYADELKAALEEVDDKTNRIEQSHRDMTDSIEYARLLQEAVLDSGDKLPGNFEHFIFFKPQSIVSGDFYFFKQINGLHVFALADCTGHGVPGGFLTMFGMNVLQEVIATTDLRNPSEALERMRKRVKNVFHSSRHHDGMDMTLCVYDPERRYLYYAGANQTAIVFSQNRKQVLKPVYNPVGYYVNECAFETKTITINQNDILYMYSDGFKDQFGGPKNKKYQFKKFSKFLSDNYEKPLWEQKQLLFNEHKRWKGKEDQLDDITVIGIKFNELC